MTYPRAGLTNAELCSAMIEAEQRKGDAALLIDVRVRSMQTFALCLQEAHRRGLNYAALRAEQGRSA